MPDPSVRKLWRAFVPRWSHAPLCGEGASRFGGRWNPIGAPTIYAACELSTAWAEYNQGFVQHPALIAQMELAGADLVDLTDPTKLAPLGVDAAIHAGEWRADLDEGREPPSHALRRRLLGEGHHGVIYPSFMSRGGSCVALWRWNEPGAPDLRVIDPEGRLPATIAHGSEGDTPFAASPRFISLAAATDAMIEGSPRLTGVGAGLRRRSALLSHEAILRWSGEACIGRRWRACLRPRGPEAIAAGTRPASKRHSRPWRPASKTASAH